MSKRHLTGHHVKCDPAESAAYSDADVAGIDILGPPSRGQDCEVFIASDQVVSNDENRSP